MDFTDHKFVILICCIARYWFLKTKYIPLGLPNSQKSNQRTSEYGINNRNHQLSKVLNPEEGY